ncbi:UDP-glucosyltransferase 29 [Sesamum angolense]|uniref:UDP-glucosyltransferase 29 n=1 Tax=Sesamum angolense TaxID=2727404 RepID=A0AAE1X432_9LAMI|nr:UDP-glucosyltransferase 29 [Sesamum angolense]
MGANKNQSIDVLMFPWLGYGHITPYLELAKKLTSRVPLFLPPLPGLPPELHTTNGLPSHLMPRLKEAFDLSVNDFSNILKQLKPHLLIYDVIQPWAPLVAKEHNIPAVEFITSSSTMTSFMFHCFRKPWIEFPFPNIYFRDYEYSDLKRLLECDPTERDGASEGVERSCKIVLIKGFKDIEGKYIDYVSSLFGKKFVPVGRLVQEPIPDEKEDDSSDFDEIAYGLELSKINFIWVVRFPKGANGHINGLLEKTLPRGFLERVGDRGKILEGWAPQTRILGHENIGGFVSHCGWNSVMEKVGVGVEVLRDRNKRFGGERLAAVIKQVVLEDCGEVVRQKAAEMRQKLKSKGDQEIDEVVKELVMVCNNS